MKKILSSTLAFILLSPVTPFSFVLQNKCLANNNLSESDVDLSVLVASTLATLKDAKLVLLKKIKLLGDSPELQELLRILDNHIIFLNSCRVNLVSINSMSGDLISASSIEELNKNLFPKNGSAFSVIEFVLKNDNFVEKLKEEYENKKKKSDSLKKSFEKKFEITFQPLKKSIGEVTETALKEREKKYKKECELKNEEISVVQQLIKEKEESLLKVRKKCEKLVKQMNDRRTEYDSKYKTMVEFSESLRKSKTGVTQEQIKKFNDMKEELKKLHNQHESDKKLLSLTNGEINSFNKSELELLTKQISSKKEEQEKLHDQYESDKSTLQKILSELKTLDCSRDSTSENSYKFESYISYLNSLNNGDLVNSQSSLKNSVDESNTARFEYEQTDVDLKRLEILSKNLELENFKKCTKFDIAKNVHYSILDVISYISKCFKGYLPNVVKKELSKKVTPYFFVMLPGSYLDPLFSSKTGKGFGKEVGTMAQLLQGTVYPNGRLHKKQGNQTPIGFNKHDKDQSVLYKVSCDDFPNVILENEVNPLRSDINRSYGGIVSLFASAIEKFENKKDKIPLHSHTAISRKPKYNTINTSDSEYYSSEGNPNVERFVKLFRIDNSHNITYFDSSKLSADIAKIMKSVSICLNENPNKRAIVVVTEGEYQEAMLQASLNKLDSNRLVIVNRK